MGVAQQRGVLDAIASALDGDDAGVVEEAVEDGAGGGDIAQEFAPFFERAVAGHEGGAVFVTAEDDLHEVLGGVLWQGFEPHVVDDEQGRGEVTAKGLFLVASGFVAQEVADQLEDGAVEDFEAHLDGAITDGLSQMRLADTWRSEKENIRVVAQECAGGQIKDRLAVDGRVEGPVELFKGFELAELGGAGASGQLSLVADVEFILEDQFEELGVAEAVGGGFLEAHRQAEAQAGEAQGFEGGVELRFHIGPKQSGVSCW